MKISIIGAGAYGMAICNVLHKKNMYSIMIETNSEEECLYLNSTRKSPKVSYDIPDDVVISTDLEKVIKNSDIIFIAVPSKFVDSVSKDIGRYYSNQYIAICSKGIDNNLGIGFEEIVKKNVNSDLVAVVSGPTFADDMVTEAILGLNVASTNEKTRDVIADVLSSNTLRADKSDDVIGIELYGAFKNVMAIGSGIISGMGYPLSSRALFMTLAYEEISNFIVLLGGKKETAFSLAGIGDFILTCNSSLSRNFSFGTMIGKGYDFDTYKDNTTIEGIDTAKKAKAIIDKMNLNMPIMSMIYDIIMGNCSPNDFIDLLINS